MTSMDLPGGMCCVWPDRQTDTTKGPRLFSASMRHKHEQLWQTAGPSGEDIIILKYYHIVTIVLQYYYIVLYHSTIILLYSTIPQYYNTTIQYYIIVLQYKIQYYIIVLQYYYIVLYHSTTILLYSTISQYYILQYHHPQPTRQLFRLFVADSLFWISIRFLAEHVMYQDYITGLYNRTI